MTRRDVLMLAGCVVLCQMAGLSGAVFTGDTEWYPRPTFHPPNWVFAPAWITLYALMGITLYLIAIAPPGRLQRWALGLFVAQFLVNAAWTPLFFGARQATAALVMIVLLLGLIVIWLIATWRVRPLAAALQVPYALWTGYATALNAAIVRML
jgi:translocator protein